MDDSYNMIGPVFFFIISQNYFVLLFQLKYCLKGFLLNNISKETKVQYFCKKIFLQKQSLTQKREKYVSSDHETDEEIADIGADAGNETEEEKTEQAVKNHRNSEAADVKAVQAFNA